MRHPSVFLALAFISAPCAADAYFIDLETFKKWPRVAQQGYVLGVVDQSVQAAYHYEPALYPIVVKCMENVDTEAMFSAVLNYVLEYKYDEPVTILIGDGVADYCQGQGYNWSE